MGQMPHVMDAVSEGRNGFSIVVGSQNIKQVLSIL